MKHNKLEGIDFSIEISLKEYGFAWIKREKDYIFYYGISYNDGEFDFFDCASIPVDLDILKEYDWIELERVLNFVGMQKEDWLNMCLPNQIFDLRNYYGYEEVFGSSYHHGLTFEEVIKKGFKS